MKLLKRRLDDVPRKSAKVRQDRQDKKRGKQGLQQPPNTAPREAMVYFPFRPEIEHTRKKSSKSSKSCPNPLFFIRAIRVIRG